MKKPYKLKLVNVHACGEVGNIAVEGVPDIPGKTMLEKMDYLNHADDSLRRFAVFEPRGKAQMSVNLLLPPSAPGADAGMLILQGDQCHSMSGSNAICMTTVLLETGRVPMREPQTKVMLDTPAGLVEATAECRGGKCVSVKLNMTPAFVEKTGCKLSFDGKDYEADVVFGGVYYALCDVAQTGLSITPENARELARIGMGLLHEAQQNIPVRHPLLPSISNIAYLMFTGKDPADGRMLNATVLSSRLDRSPCGTGSNARMALMHSRGEVALGDRITFNSIIGSRFDAELLGVADVGGRQACRVSISGQGWIYGTQEISADPSDPFPLGFTVNDMW